MRRFIIFLFVLMPLMLFARINTHHFFQHGSHVPLANNRDRSWRLHETLYEETDNGNWVDVSKYVYYYNHEYPSAIDSIEQYSYDIETATWGLSTSIVYTYELTYEYVTNVNYYGIELPSTRELVMSYELEYNENNYLTKSTLTGPDQQTGDWTIYERTDFTYELDHLASMMLYETFFTYDNPFYWKIDFSHDALGRIILQTNQISPDSTNWVNDQKMTSIYYTDDTSTGADFCSGLAHYYTFDLNHSSISFWGMLDSKTIQTWVENAWINEYSDTYAYNNNGQLIEFLEQEWQDVNFYWYNQTRNVCTYDENGNLYQYLGQGWNGANDWNNFVMETNTWEQPTTIDDHTTPATNGLSFSAYPNPFQAKMNIRVNAKSNQPVQIEVFNIKGQSVYKTDAMPNTQISMEGMRLSSGIYFVKAKQGNETNTHKILKLN